VNKDDHSQLKLAATSHLIMNFNKYYRVHYLSGNVSTSPLHFHYVVKVEDKRKCNNPQLISATVSFRTQRMIRHNRILNLSLLSKWRTGN